MGHPKWATPQRQATLINLFARSNGFCVFGESPCPCPEHHHYETFAESLIDDWKRLDRETRKQEWNELQKLMHGLGEAGKPKGQFSAVSRRIFFESQSEFYVETMGIDALTFKPFAKVRLAGSHSSLFVDIEEALRGVSKNKRRKALRYQTAKYIEQRINHLCGLAVKSYLSR